MHYSDDTRMKVVALIAGGMTSSAASRALGPSGPSRQTIDRWNADARKKAEENAIIPEAEQVEILPGLRQMSRYPAYQRAERMLTLTEGLIARAINAGAPDRDIARLLGSFWRGIETLLGTQRAFVIINEAFGTPLGKEAPDLTLLPEWIRYKKAELWALEQLGDGIPERFAKLLLKYAEEHKED